MKPCHPVVAVVAMMMVGGRRRCRRRRGEDSGRSGTGSNRSEGGISNGDSCQSQLAMGRQ